MNPEDFPPLQPPAREGGTGEPNGVPLAPENCAQSPPASQNEGVQEISLTTSVTLDMLRILQEQHNFSPDEIFKVATAFGTYEFVFTDPRNNPVVNFIAALEEDEQISEFVSPMQFILQGSTILSAAPLHSRHAVIMVIEKFSNNVAEKISMVNLANPKHVRDLPLYLNHMSAIFRDLCAGCPAVHSRA